MKHKIFSVVAGLFILANGNVKADCNSCCFNFCNTNFELLLGAEGLYWTVDQTNLDYAVDLSDLLGSDEVVGPGDVHFLEYDWTGGVRFLIGLKGQSGWNLNGVLTYYQNKSSNSHSGSGDTNLLATLVHPATIECEADEASLSSKIQYYTYDLLLGASITSCADSLEVQPYFGVRAMTLKQNLNATYEGVDFEDINDNSAPGNVKYHSELQAIGLLAGMDIDYYIFKGFGLYGGFAGSILGGRSNNHQRQYLLDADFNIDETGVNFKEKEHLLVTGYHLRAGVNWKSCFDYGRHMLFSVGYEFNQWFNTPQFRRFSDDNCPGVSSGNRGSIGLHGATATLVLYF